MACFRHFAGVKTFRIKHGYLNPKVSVITDFVCLESNTASYGALGTLVENDVVSGVGFCDVWFVHLFCAEM